MLVGKSVYLRNIKPADIMILHQWENDPEVKVFGMEKSHVTIGTLRQYISSIQDIYIAKQLRLMIGLKEGHVTIGTIDLFDFNADQHTAGVSILIADKEQRGKGYGDEALKLLITYCCDSLKVNRLFCNIEGKNEVSMKLFLNNGFKLVKQDDDWFGDDTFLNDENVSQLVR